MELVSFFCSLMLVQSVVMYGLESLSDWIYYTLQGCWASIEKYPEGLGVKFHYLASPTSFTPVVDLPGIYLQSLNGNQNYQITLSAQNHVLRGLIVGKQYYGPSYSDFQRAFNCFPISLQIEQLETGVVLKSQVRFDLQLDLLDKLESRDIDDELEISSAEESSGSVSAEETSDVSCDESE